MPRRLPPVGLGGEAGLNKLGAHSGPALHGDEPVLIAAHSGQAIARLCREEIPGLAVATARAVEEGNSGAPARNPAVMKGGLDCRLQRLQSSPLVQTQLWAGAGSQGDELELGHLSADVAGLLVQHLGLV